MTATQDLAPTVHPAPEPQGAGKTNLVNFKDVPEFEHNAVDARPVRVVLEFLFYWVRGFPLQWWRQGETRQTRKRHDQLAGVEHWHEM